MLEKKDFKEKLDNHLNDFKIFLFSQLLFLIVIGGCYIHHIYF